MVLVKSKQKNIIVKNSNPTFSYGFSEKPVEMKKEHADILAENSNFEIVSQTKKTIKKETKEVYKK